ncbi:hypothetical protein BN1708_019634, partial [Verticillium longisporum]
HLVDSCRHSADHHSRHRHCPRGPLRPSDLPHLGSRLRLHRARALPWPLKQVLLVAWLRGHCRRPRWHPHVVPLWCHLLRWRRSSCRQPSPHL